MANAPWQVPGQTDPNSTQLPAFLQQLLQQKPAMPTLAPQGDQAPVNQGPAPVAPVVGPPAVGQAPNPASQAVGATKAPEEVKTDTTGKPPVAPAAAGSEPVVPAAPHIMTREEFDAQHKATIPSAPVGPFDKIPEGQPGADTWGNRHNKLREGLTIGLAGLAEAAGRLGPKGRPGEGQAVLQPWLQTEAAKREYQAQAPAQQEQAQQKEYEDYVKNEVQKAQAGYYNNMEGKGLAQNVVGYDPVTHAPIFGAAGSLANAKANETQSSANLKDVQQEVALADKALKEAQANYEKYKMDPNSWMAQNAAAHLKQAQANFELSQQKFNFTRTNDFNKVYVDPINRGAEQSYRMMQQAYKEYQDAAAKGEELPTGAQSMLALSSHLQTTFGVVKGARVTKDMIAEHLGARGLTDKAVVAVQNLVNGDQLSPDQWEAFTQLVSQSRNLQWQIAAETANNRGVDPNTFLPPDLRQGQTNPMAGAPSNPAGPPAVAPTPAPKQAAPAAGGFDWNKYPVKKTP